MRFAIHTLGCKVNQYESAALAAELQQRGHTAVPFDDEADAYLINTCTVTAVSDKKSRQAIRQARRRAPRALVAVCGCFSQVSSEEVAALEVDLVAGTTERMAFVGQVESLVAQRQASQPPMVLVEDVTRYHAFEPLSAQGSEGRTRAFLKIQDGCDNFCSYCIIPYARGRATSRPPEDVSQAVVDLVEGGYQEIVLTGIEISSWGKDRAEDESLIDLVEMVCAQLPSHVRLRLGSLEPRTITEDFCRRAAGLGNLCPHFHLSLQSGCDTVLKRMNRKYDTGRFLASVAHLREFFPSPALTTDLIVGFPGETDEEFAQTLAFLEACQLSSMHIFPYSIRPGTPAATMKPQVPGPIKDARAKATAALATEMEHTYLDSWIGQTLPVLFETQQGELWRGHAPQYFQVEADGEDLSNQIRHVLITHRQGTCLMGTLSAISTHPEESFATPR